MAFDGTLKFDTSIDKSGFESGLAKLGSIAKTGMKAVAGAITAASGAMAALGTKALEAYADYEQLTGGVATLFGAQDMSLEEYAQSIGKTVDAVKGEYDNLIAAQDAVMQNASSAFRTAGLSQNEYMETVTSFSAALIASLDGDTAKAAEVADRAIVDMADNANKMGSSMESIQNAYQGFAKQNYTMLDNLKLGYGGTKSEMERLLADAQAISGIEFSIDSYADVVEAIHVIQTQMGITGTTAREAAETISGSVGMTKAAFINLLVGIADDEQDFEKLIDDLVSSATAAAGNILPRVETIIGGIGKLITSLSGVAADMIVDLTAYIPDLVNAGVSLIKAVAEGLIANAPAIAEAIFQAGALLLDGLFSIAGDLFNFGTQVIAMLADSISEHQQEIIESARTLITSFAESMTANLPIILDSAVQIIGSLLEILLDPGVLTSLLDAGLQIILTLAQSILDNIPQIITIVSTLITNIVDFLIAAVPMLLDAAVQLFMAIVDALPKILDALTRELPRILEAVTKLIPQLVTAISKALPQIISAVTQAIPIIIQAIVQALPMIINALTEALVSFNTQMVDAAILLFDALLDALPVINEALLEALPVLIESLVELLIESAPQILKASVSLFMAIVEALPQIFDSLSECFGEMASLCLEWLAQIGLDALESVKTGLTTILENGKQLASDIVTGIMQFLDELPGKIGHMIGEALGHIVQFAIDAPQKARELAEEFVANVIEFFSTLPEKAKKWLDDTLEKVVSWASDLATKGKEGADDLVKKVTEGISVLPGKMLEAGKNIVDGLWNGITSMGGWLRDQISGFAGGIIDGFKESFGIASPSKVMRDSIGKYLAQGLGVGFTEEIPQIGKAALDAFSHLDLPEIGISANIVTPKQSPHPQIDSDAVRMLQTAGGYTGSDFVQPSATSEIINNNYYSTTNNRTDSASPVINVHVHCETEMDGEKVAEMVAEKVDILQGEAVTMDERGTAH